MEMEVEEEKQRRRRKRGERQETEQELRRKRGSREEADDRRTSDASRPMGVQGRPVSSTDEFSTNSKEIRRKRRR